MEQCFAQGWLIAILRWFHCKRISSATGTGVNAHPQQSPELTSVWVLLSEASLSSQSWSFFHRHVLSQWPFLSSLSFLSGCFLHHSLPVQSRYCDLSEPLPLTLQCGATILLSLVSTLLSSDRKFQGNGSILQKRSWFGNQVWHPQ